MSESSQQLAHLLANYWGPEFSLRPQQEAIIQALIQKKDALVLLPTGAGKSLCFQLSGLYLGGITIIISPLIALMEDQVHNLKEKNLNAAFLHSQQSKSARQKKLAELQKEGGFLYIAPEQLKSRDIQSLLQNCPPSLLILDEAHCISIWGHDFRPSYKQVIQAFQTLPHRPPVAAFTATAPPEVLQDIETILDLKEALHFTALPLRDNIALQIHTFWTPRGKKQALLKALKSAPKTLIYLATRKGTEDLAQIIETQLKRPILTYHAGQPQQERQEAYQKYKAEKKVIMLATKAFGMGIDIPDIAQVIHWQLPDALENYVQEVGRAGRAAEMKAQAHLLVLKGEAPPSQNFQKQFDCQPEIIRQVLKAMKKKQSIYQIQDRLNLSQVQLNIIQGVLEEENLLSHPTPFEYQLAPEGDSKTTVQHIHKRFQTLKHKQKNKFKAVKKYIKSKSCRLQFIDCYFGQSPRSACGQCDRCQKQ